MTETEYDDQVTNYVYGTATGGITPVVYRNDLLRAEIYPDSDDPVSLTGEGKDSTYDRVEYKYNRQGEVIEKNRPTESYWNGIRQMLPHHGAVERSTRLLGTAANMFAKCLRFPEWTNSCPNFHRKAFPVFGYS